MFIAGMILVLGWIAASIIGTWAYFAKPRNSWL
jgi:hypothetical protein